MYSKFNYFKLNKKKEIEFSTLKNYAEKFFIILKQNDVYYLYD